MEALAFGGPVELRNSSTLYGTKIPDAMLGTAVFRDTLKILLGCNTKI